MGRFGSAHVDESSPTPSLPMLTDVDGRNSGVDGLRQPSSPVKNKLNKVLVREMAQ